MTNAYSKYLNRERQSRSCVCVGLDSDLKKIPKRFATLKYPQFAFNKWIIEQTHPFTLAYKPNFAFYEARGVAGMEELLMTMEYLRTHHPEIFTIADAKRADIGNTNVGYVESIFDHFGFDAVTLHPYLGKEALQPFLERADKVSIVLCRTSNPGAPEFQDLEVGGQKLWSVIARKVSTTWNERGNCMLVVGATYPEELAKVREIVGDMALLIPGIGAQGGDLHATVQFGMNQQKSGLLISASRSIIFSSNPQQETLALCEHIRSLLG